MLQEFTVSGPDGPGQERVIHRQPATKVHESERYSQHWEKYITLREPEPNQPIQNIMIYSGSKKSQQ